jgi:choline kinase
MINKINKYLENTNFQPIKTGKTTIEIIKKGLSKRNLFIRNNFLTENYTYITDTNDILYDICSDTNKILNIKDINDTNIFLKSIIINEKYDFCIIVGGINKRMEINYPKCLIEVDNEIILMKIINHILPYSNNIFICGNNYYKHHFSYFEKTLSNYNNIKFLYFNSVDNSQDYPKGNGETIYQLINTLNLTNKLFIMWGDIILSNEKIIEEMYNLQYDNDFLIPTVYEEDPYAYLILDNNNIKDIGYKKNLRMSYGYHDQCIFLCDKNVIKNNLELLINNNDKDELNFLDLVKYIKNVSYYETNYPVKSFNTKNELF